MTSITTWRVRRDDRGPRDPRLITRHDWINSVPYGSFLIHTVVMGLSRPLATLLSAAAAGALADGAGPHRRPRFLDAASPSWPGATTCPRGGHRLASPPAASPSSSRPVEQVFTRSTGLTCWLPSSCRRRTPPLPSVVGSRLWLNRPWSVRILPGRPEQHVHDRRPLVLIAKRHTTVAGAGHMHVSAEFSQRRAATCLN